MLLVEVTPSPGLLLFWKGNRNKDYFGFLFQQRSCVRMCWALQHTFLLMKIIGIIISSLDVEQTNSLVRLINSAGVNASEISRRQELARGYRAPCTLNKTACRQLWSCFFFRSECLDAEASHSLLSHFILFLQIDNANLDRFEAHKETKTPKTKIHTPSKDNRTGN